MQLKCLMIYEWFIKQVNLLRKFLWYNRNHIVYVEKNLYKNYIIKYKTIINFTSFSNKCMCYQDM